jgi:outer membrane lipoprotein-sorting protein
MAGAALVQTNANAAQKAFDTVIAKLNKLESLSVELQFKSGTKQVSYPMHYMKPDLYRFKMNDDFVMCDGTSRYVYMGGPKQFMVSDASGLKGIAALPAFSFVLDATNLGIKAVKLTNGKLKGKATKILNLHSDQHKMDLVLTVDASTSYPLAMVIKPIQGPPQELTFAKFVPNAKLDKSLFVWKAPEGATLYKQTEYKQPDPAANLLKVGTQAPDFELKTTGGTVQKLSSYFGKGKAVLVNFWFYG